MKFPTLFFAFTIAIIVTGCGAGNEDARSEPTASSKQVQNMNGLTAEAGAPARAGASDQAKAVVDTDSPASPTPEVLQNRMVIRSATIAVRVENVEKSEQTVGQLVRGAGGYVGTATSSDLASENPVLTISMRVPAQSFDSILGRIEALGVRLSKSIASEDVTEQVVDMDARIRTMKVEEETYRRLLAKAQSTQEMIPLQTRLTELRGTIESITAQRASLAKQASLSTIQLTLQQNAILNKPPQDPNWLAQSWGSSTTTFGGLLRNLANIGIWLLVFSPLWAPILYFVLRNVRRSSRVA